MIDRACISLGNQCNLNCRYCHFHDKKASPSCFTSDEIETIIEHIYEYCQQNKIGRFKLGLVGAGEPLLEIDTILSALKYVKESGFSGLAFYTITNGVLFTTDIAEQFAAYRDLISVCFSLDGYEELHNAGRMEFNRVMDAISIYKRVYGCSPSINATVNHITVNNKDEVIAFFKKHNLLNVTFSRLVSCDDPLLKITNEEFAEFMGYAKNSGICSRQFRQDKCYDCTMYGKYCGVGRTNIFITPEGIYPCGRFYTMNDYRLSDWDAPIETVNMAVAHMKPVADGRCYYADHVEAKL